MYRKKNFLYAIISLKETMTPPPNPEWYSSTQRGSQTLESFCCVCRFVHGLWKFNDYRPNLFTHRDHLSSSTLQHFFLFQDYSEHIWRDAA